MNESIEFCPEAVAALRQGKKIEAIKIVRERNGMGLKEAKEAVEAYADQHSIEMSGISITDSSGALFKLFVAGLIVLVAYFILK